MPKEWVPYERATEYIRSLGLKGYKEFVEWAYHSKERPEWFPSKPERVYRDRWVSWPDFLGSDSRQGASLGVDREKIYAPYDEVLGFVHQLGLKNKRDFYDWSSRSGDRPEWLPTKPDQVYRGKGWTTWADFLGASSKGPVDEFGQVVDRQDDDGQDAQDDEQKGPHERAGGHEGHHMHHGHHDDGTSHLLPHAHHHPHPPHPHHHEPHTHHHHHHHHHHHSDHHGHPPPSHGHHLADDMILTPDQQHHLLNMEPGQEVSQDIID